jgi:hypothetical protein
MSVTVIQDHTGRIARQLRTLERKTVTIGVHGDSGTHGNTGETVASIAAQHEFGTSQVPERSFLRAGMAAKGDEIAMDLIDQIQHMIEGGTPQPGQIALRGGVLVLGAVRETIAAGIAPELSPTTKQRRDEKGSNSTGVASNVGQYTPLVDTGQLWQSLVVRVGEAG